MATRGEAGAARGGSGGGPHLDGIVGVSLRGEAVVRPAKVAQLQRHVPLVVRGRIKRPAYAHNKYIVAARVGHNSAHSGDLLQHRHDRSRGAVNICPPPTFLYSRNIVLECSGLGSDSFNGQHSGGARLMHPA